MLEAYSDRIIVRLVNIEVKTAGGLFLSAGEVDENRDIVFGRVVAVGEGKQIEPPHFIKVDAGVTDVLTSDNNNGIIPMKTKVGDLVAFNERIPLRQHYKGEYIYILRESDILYRNTDTDIVEKAFESIKAMNGGGAKFLG